MLISRDDPRFWDVRTRERRLRAGEMETAEVEAHLEALPDVTEKATASNPLDEPDERAHERRAHIPYVRVTMPPPRDESDDDLYDDDDEDDEDDEEDDEEDDDDLG